MRPFLAATLVLWGCAAGPDRAMPTGTVAGLWPELVGPGPSPESGELAPPELVGVPRRRVNWTLARYLEESQAEYEEGRDLVCEDPASAYWLTRKLIEFARVAQQTGVTDERALVLEPAWERPLREVVALGHRAVPAVVLLLVANARPDCRDLGTQILTRMGQDAVPSWAGLFGVADGHVRRAGARVLASFGEPAPATRELAGRLLGDPDIGVRAFAYRVLARVDGAEVEPLLAALRQEDPFVRREVARGLASHRARAVAVALVDYLDRCLRDRDSEGARAAVQSLVTISGLDAERSLDDWRAWLRTYSGG